MRLYDVLHLLLPTQVITVEVDNEITFHGRMKEIAFPRKDIEAYAIYNEGDAIVIRCYRR